MHETLKHAMDQITEYLIDRKIDLAGLDESVTELYDDLDKISNNVDMMRDELRNAITEIRDLRQLLNKKLTSPEGGAR